MFKKTTSNLWTYSLTAIAGLFLTFSAHANDYIVSSLADSGSGTLREAIEFANANPALDTIHFNVSGTITILSELPTISDVMIDGTGQTVEISGNDLCRVFVASGAVTLKSLTISHGRANFGNICNIANSSSSGGGVYYTSGTLNVDNCKFAYNHADGDGGAIKTASNGNLNVTASTFDNNKSGRAGGAFEAFRSAAITNSTFTSNTSETGGGAIYADQFSGDVVTVSNCTFFGNSSTGSSIPYGGGAIQADGSTGTSMTVINSTITGNSSVVPGGGVFARTGTIYLQNSIVAGNTGSDCGFETAGTDFVSADSYNVVSDTSCDSATQKTVAEINLGPLQDNGGPTQTMALLTSPVLSAAIDAGNASVCAAAPVNNLDQRGLTRLVGASCDIGAFELQPPPPVADFSATPLSGNVPLDVTFTDSSTYATSWSWDFGDGGTSTEQNPSHTYTSPGLYSVSLTVANAAGNDTQVKTDYITAIGDSTPPTMPSNLQTTNLGANSIALAWTAATDNVGVAGYSVSIGATPLGSTTNTNYTVTGLSCGTSYIFGVQAYDAAGNLSSKATLAATTLACTPSAIAQITTTATCQTFRDGAAADLNTVGYTVKSNKVNSLSPGTFFYYVKFTATSTSVPINQADNSSVFGVIAAKTVSIYDATTCVKASGSAIVNGGGVLLSGLTIGSSYIVAVKYDPTVLKNTSAAGNPTVNYSFTLSGYSGSTDTVSVTKK